MRDYLPPDGIGKDEFITRIIEAVDNPDIAPVIAEIEGREAEIRNAADERAAIVKWLRHRVEMASPLPSHWRPLKRLEYKWMRGTFEAVARLLERNVHYSSSLEEERLIIHSARFQQTKPERKLK